MSDARNALTPESLFMLQAIAESGSFAAAARKLGLVPSALTYRVRQIEDALDVLLFDRNSRHANPTEAGHALLQDADRLLREIDTVAHRVKRVATGWEPQLTIAIDGLISRETMFELIQHFYELSPPTQLKIIEGVLTGTLEALTSGRADLAIGINIQTTEIANLQTRDLGDVPFCFVVGCSHPLASHQEPISDEILRKHRLIVVADSNHKDPASIGLLHGQETLTVDNLQSKIDAQVHGLGCGFIPETLAQPYIEQGLLTVKAVERPRRNMRLRYGWKNAEHIQPGRALRWWLQQLESQSTKQALLHRSRKLYMS